MRQVSFVWSRLLDLMLPQLDGITLCRRLRSAKCTAPILMLTARDTTTDKVVGRWCWWLLVKPFEIEELSAELELYHEETRQPVLSCGDLQLTSTCKVTYAGKVLSLTPKGTWFRILFWKIQLDYSIAHHSTNYGTEQLPGNHQNITSLRRKLKQIGSSENIIETVYGLGYRLRCNWGITIFYKLQQVPCTIMRIFCVSENAVPVAVVLLSSFRINTDDICSWSAYRFCSDPQWNI